MSDQSPNHNESRNQRQADDTDDKQQASSPAGSQQRPQTPITQGFHHTPPQQQQAPAWLQHHQPKYFPQQRQPLSYQAPVTQNAPPVSLLPGAIINDRFGQDTAQQPDQLFQNNNDQATERRVPPTHYRAPLDERGAPPLIQRDRSQTQDFSDRLSQVRRDLLRILRQSPGLFREAALAQVMAGLVDEPELAASALVAAVRELGVLDGSLPPDTV
ncbi:hypothetical protein EG328_009501 [Venturia inaequalis]|uniref:Uncharacterized protein n=1 Tax=Venturia inaequalis TaxID=5025 RepID=A0A8H3U9N2_VENIN|nr:hypothetical protein EG328_009501 [Venturia inaequalis]KAE9978850.1 hypothetical protein EG327_007265 [Venturia inaequalis]RDI87550.1 hypothetical protein Vi05172_g2586 [Venturia inaequalis]